MSQELDNSPEDFLRNIADELTTISGECTEIKQAQLSAATTDNLKAHAERMESVLTDGVIPAVNLVKELIKKSSHLQNKFRRNIRSNRWRIKLNR